jgi:hypothetical protein
VYLDQKAEIGASAVAAGLRRWRDLRREEEWKRGKRGKREKEKREMRKERENQFNEKKRGILKQMSY